MTKDRYIEILTLAAATLLAGRVRVPEYGSVVEVAVGNAGEIYAEAVKLADREYPAKAEGQRP